MPESGHTGMGDGVWMTKAEFAAARRISIDSAHRLIRQCRWERQPGDDGRIRVLVPRRWAEDRASSGAAATTALINANPDAPPACGGQDGVVDTLRAELVRLRGELETARSGRRQAELERDEARQGRITVERDLNEARQEAERARQTAATLRNATETAAAEERAEQITRDAAFAQLRRLTETMATRRSLGRWARLRLAWRGE